MKRSSKLKIEKSSGNVFADLKLPDSEEYIAKAELAYQINRLINQKGLTQHEAANLLGIDQPKVSALSRGNLTGFSIERLFKFLFSLNQDIKIVIRPHPEHKNHAAPRMQIQYVRS